MRATSGPERAKLFHRRTAIFRVPHDSHIRLEIQHRRQPVADHGMVVGDQNPDGIGHVKIRQLEIRQPAR